MSRTRKHIKQYHRKSDKLPFPRNKKRFNNDFLDEEGEMGQRIMSNSKVLHVGHRHYYDGYSDVGPNINWLKRLLYKRVGQPWADVKSEILSSEDSRTFEGRLVRDGIEWTVNENCVIKNGVVVARGGIEYSLGNGWSDDFYVHPETKTLEIVKGTGKPRYKPEQKIFEMDGVLYHEFEGLWYRVKMSPLPKKTRSRCYWYNETIEDVFYPESYDLTRKYGRSPEGTAWYCYWKQSANHREIQKLTKLKNKAA